MAGNVKRIPEGCHSVTPHLTVRDASKAIAFYQKAFGAKEVRRSPGPDGRLMFAELQLGDSRFYLNDEFPEMGGKSPLALNGTPVVIHHYVEDVDRVFQQALAAGATVRFPLADQFWGDRYGILVDPFGHHWAVASHVKDVTPADLAKAAESFAAHSKPKT